MAQRNRGRLDSLLEALQELVNDWQEIAVELRARADRRARNDLETGYMYGLADGYERNAKKITHLITTQEPQRDPNPAPE